MVIPGKSASAFIMVRRILAASAALVVVAAAAAANPLLERGTITFGLEAGGWRWVSGAPAGTTGHFSVSPEAGVFVTKGLWLGGRVGIGYLWAPSETGPETSYSDYVSVAGGADYYFDLGRWAPFAGLWGTFGDFPDKGFAPRAGAKFFVVPRTALAVYYEGQVGFPGYGAGAVTSHTLNYGFRVFF
jgi:hypothetical protein